MKISTPKTDAEFVIQTLPKAHRAQYAARLAACAELAHIRTVAKDPLTALLRLQWWADAICADTPPIGHPTLQAIFPNRALLQPIIDARRAEIACNGVYVTETDFNHTTSALHTIWLGCPETAQKWGTMQAICGLPAMSRSGLCFAPQSWFDFLQFDPHQIHLLTPTTPRLTELVRHSLNALALDLNPATTTTKQARAALYLLRLKQDALAHDDYNPFVLKPNHYQRFLSLKLRLASLFFADTL